MKVTDEERDAVVRIATMVTLLVWAMFSTAQLIRTRADLHKTERAWISTVIMYGHATNPKLGAADFNAIDKAMTGASRTLTMDAAGNVGYGLYVDRKGVWTFVPRLLEGLEANK